MCPAPSRPMSPPRLRGGAPHEAERRCGARAGGAGWVGPPATRRRRCVLRQRGDQLVAGLEQFLFVDDVVAVRGRQRRDQPLIGRLLGVHRSFPGCDGARQCFTHVAKPFADTFLLGDVTVAYGRVQPRLARRPLSARAYAVVRRTRRRGGAGRGLAGYARPRGVACACCAR